MHTSAGCDVTGPRREIPRTGGALRCPLCHHAPTIRTVLGGHMRTRATITLAAALLATLTACSSDDDDSADAAPPAASSPATASSPAAETSAPPADDAELTEAVQDYTRAYFAGEASTAYGMLSERCRGKANELVFGATVKQAAEAYGPDHAATDVQAEVSGEMARVSYKVEGLPKFDQTGQPWALEGGAWKYDAC